MAEVTFNVCNYSCQGGHSLKSLYPGTKQDFFAATIYLGELLRILMTSCGFSSPTAWCSAVVPSSTARCRAVVLYNQTNISALVTKNFMQ